MDKIIGHSLYEEAQKYYARMSDVLGRGGFARLEADDIIELMVIFTEDRLAEFKKNQFYVNEEKVRRDGGTI